MAYDLSFLRNKHDVYPKKNTVSLHTIMIIFKWNCSSFFLYKNRMK